MESFNYGGAFVGQTLTFTHRVTNEEIRCFVELTEDSATLHTDKEVAQKYNYNDQVVPGILLLALFSKIGGLFFPGTHYLLLQVKCRFIKTVLCNEETTIFAEIKELSDVVPRSVIAAKVMANGETVMRGEVVVGFLD